MLISEICNNEYIKKHVNAVCVVDGEFDSVGLLGLRKNEEEKHIAYLLDIKYLDNAVEDGMECIIAPPHIEDELVKRFNGGICIAEDPKAALFSIHEVLSIENVLPDTQISETARISPASTIPSKGIFIGENTVISENVVLHGRVTIGDNCTIMPGCVIGSPAFYYYELGGKKKMVYSSGGVTIGNNVTLHPNTTVCRGVIGGDTVIGDEVCLDSHVFLGHDAQIDKGCILAAGCSLGGWSTVGEDTFFGVNVCVAPMKNVGKRVKGNIGAVITTDVPDDSQYSGNFAIEHSVFVRDLKNRLR